ncbi:MAG: MMPL family transporter [Candidatus Methanoperedens sp.]|nr:MMPL family transporter [Candidatus Methanoperedens sp.]MCZ7404501.1 MMPL family transporter [Candidatus Methanoperedens sp.]
MIKEILEKYSSFVTRHPITVLIIMLVVSFFAIQMAGSIETKKSDTKSMLPNDVESISTLNSIENEFGSTNAVFFAVELDPQYNGSDEKRDIRDPKIIQYMDQLSVLALHTDNVIDVGSAASVLKTINNGRLPQSVREISALTDKNGLLGSYVSNDYTLALVKIQTTDDVDLKALEVELNKIITDVPKPPGVTVALGGNAMESTVMEKSIGPDMAKTSLYSLIGILIIILALFRSIKYGFTPMTTIIFGTLWAMGYVGLIGMGLSSQTSGVLSMIMGIGIDFGIQVVTRYRFELENKLVPRDAMAMTLNNVIIPMSTTTLAALIGFQAMSLGKLTFLGDMGTIMSYGVAASMVAAITVVPALIIIIDTMNIKDTYKKIMNNLR